MTTPEQTQQILQTLAVSNPDFAQFQRDFAVQDTAQLLPELLDDTLAVLSEDPQQAMAITALSQSAASSKSFMTGGEVATLLAVAFLLRTHLKVERGTTGKWKFLAEYKPGDSKLLTGLLQKLEAWMGGTSP